MKTQKEKIAQIKGRCVALIKSRPDLQEEMAKKMGIGQNAFRQYATGRTPVPLYHLETFCEFMGVSIEYIITGKERPLLEAYNAATPDDKRLAEKVLGIKKIEPQKKHHAA